jgi:hypothetical protein
MYPVRRFERDHFDFGGNENPMSLVGLVEEVEKRHLVGASKDDGYQVINLITREYFDPKSSKWVKIQKF